MAFSGGVFSRIYEWVTDAGNGVKISSSRMDTEMDGFATGLSMCLLKDGTQTVTANIPMAGFKLTDLGNGTVSGDALHYGQIGTSGAKIPLLNGNNTYSGSMTVTGSFTSLGIDDNATAARLQIADLAITVGATGVSYGIHHVGSNSYLYYSGGTTAADGGVLTVFGGTHASQANDVEISSGTDIVYHWDDSVDTHIWGTPTTPELMSLDDGGIELSTAVEAAIDDDGTKSSGTYTPITTAGTNCKKIVNGGAFTLAPPSPQMGNNAYVAMDLLILNTTGAGAVTTSSFTKVTGDAFTTTSTHKFLCRITVYDVGGTEYSHLDVVALQ